MSLEWSNSSRFKFYKFLKIWAQKSRFSDALGRPVMSLNGLSSTSASTSTCNFNLGLNFHIFPLTYYRTDESARPLARPCPPLFKRPYLQNHEEF